MKAHAWKACMRENVSGVRIPSSPPNYAKASFGRPTAILIEDMWHVYVIKSKKEEFTYIGSTNDLRRRFAEHNNYLVQSTKHYVPFELEMYICVKTELKARELEQYFKTGSGKAILKKRFLNPLADEVI